ncbi:MAG: caspase family protein, partial [Campylobacterota bacterium]|nr:caspase family protein [Campylobacterota bacterium]
YLVAEKLTKQSIFKVAQEIAKKATLEDTVLFYISTHGRAAKGRLYLVPYNNTQLQDWIDFEQTFKAIQSIKALNQIFILDTCESGKANDIVSAIYDSRASVLAKSSGVHMLLATTRGTAAFEHPNPNIKNGVFTYQILNAMSDSTTDQNRDSLISIKELSQKLREEGETTNFQRPIIRNVGRDIIVEKIDY